MPTRLTSIPVSLNELGRPSLALLRAVNKAGLAFSEFNGLGPDHPKFLDFLHVLVAFKARAIDPAITDAEIEMLELEFPDADDDADGEPDPPKPAPAKRTATRSK